MGVSKFARVFGVILLIVGILGFVPGATTDGHLLGIFHVDTVHNIIHILTGILALMFATSAPRTFFKVFGVVYLLVTIIGFVQGDTVLGLFVINGADNILHLVISIVALAVGFKKDSSPAPMGM
jgi:hypothetical protein